MQLGAEKDTEDQLKLLYHSALLRAGFEIQDLSSFQKIFQNMMKDQFGIPRTVNKIELELPEEPLEQAEVPKAEETKETPAETDEFVEEKVESFEQATEL